MTACEGSQPTHANIVLLCQAFSIIAVKSAVVATTRKSLFGLQQSPDNFNCLRGIMQVQANTRLECSISTPTAVRGK